MWSRDRYCYYAFPASPVPPPRLDVPRRQEPCLLNFPPYLAWSLHVVGAQWVSLNRKRKKIEHIPSTCLGDVKRSNIFGSSAASACLPLLITLKFPVPLLLLFMVPANLFPYFLFDSFCFSFHLLIHCVFYGTFLRGGPSWPSLPE